MIDIKEGDEFIITQEYLDECKAQGFTSLFILNQRVVVRHIRIVNDHPLYIIGTEGSFFTAMRPEIVALLEKVSL